MFKVFDEEEKQDNKSAQSYIVTLHLQGSKVKHPLPDIVPQVWLERLSTFKNVVYVNGQLEQASSLHIQAYVHLKTAAKGASLKKFQKELWFKAVGKDNGASSYAMKESTRVDGPWEFGKMPIKRNCATDWAMVKAQAIAGNFDEIDEEIYIKHHRNLRAIYLENCTPENFEDVRGVWIHGWPGSGKTTFARTEYGGPDTVYCKAQNKWWDGYNPKKHTTIVLDDLDTACMSHLLKIWSDKWSSFGEVKGSSVPLNYTRFVITSNFTIA